MLIHRLFGSQGRLLALVALSLALSFGFHKSCARARHETSSLTYIAHAASHRIAAGPRALPDALQKPARGCSRLHEMRQRTHLQTTAPSQRLLPKPQNTHKQLEGCARPSREHH